MNRLVAVLAVALTATLPVAAQVLYGSLTGVVQDSAGAVVPGASVKVRNAATSQEFSAQTNDAGGYTFSKPRFGRLRVDVQRQWLPSRHAPGNCGHSEYSPPRGRC